MSSRVHHAILTPPLFWAAVLLLTAPPAPAANEPARANNAFCFSLLEQQRAAEDNWVCSPFSLWSALAMTSAGAEDETLQQMRTVLSLPEKEPHAAIAEWTTALKQSQEVEMKVANRLWGRKGLPFRPEFLKTTHDHYSAGLETLDFAGDTDGSSRAINQWVAESTAGRIKDLLSPGVIKADTQIVLTNAVYFKGAWFTPFDADNTRKRDFTLTSGKQIEVETMRDQFAAAYMEDRRLQAVRLPYKGEEMAMVLVLPKQAAALGEPGFLSADDFSKILAKIRQEKKVVVQLPRFEASAKMDLAETLSRIGMARAFTQEAQFGRLCGKPTRLSSVIHQAWIKVAEKGTEAAAATAVVAPPVVSAPVKQTPPKEFIADHPFLFFVIDTRNGGIIFAGRVMDPSR